MSELHTRLREILAALAASDPSCKRFGASRHRYERLPPVTASELTIIEERLGGALPDGATDYADYITRFSAGGVGPYYGLFLAGRAAAHLVTAPPKSTWTRALPLSHLGCGYLAVLPLDGPGAGQIWIDARGLGIAQPIAPSFTAFVLDWIDRLAHNQWPEGHVPVGSCAFQGALSGYLHMSEESLGLEPGQLAGQALRDALADLGPGSIRIAAEGALWNPDDAVDPCITCARTIENLASDGLSRDVLAPGVPPYPARD